MRHRLATGIAFALVLAAALIAPAAPAQESEPQVYFFWSASCPFSKAARAFLAGAQARDQRLQVRDFEVDESIANTRLLGRLYELIGMPDLHVVPVVVVGHHVVIGYIDDASTGAEIMGDIAECRKTGCKDVMRELIEEQNRFEAVAAIAPMRRAGCSREPGRAVR